MARNRLLFNFLATVVGLGAMIGLTFINTGGNAGVFGIIAAAVIVGGGLLGFLAYRNDGVKIAGAISAILAIIGIVFGILMITGAENVINIFPENIAGFFLGIVGVVLTIVFGVIFIGTFIGAAIVFIVSAVIGSMIGNGVWRDKTKEELEIADAHQPSEASQTAYEPVQPTQPSKKSGEVFCTNCGATNVAEDEFCTSCGSKLKKA